MFIKMDMQLGRTRSHIPSPIRHNQSVKIYLILLKIIFVEISCWFSILLIKTITRTPGEEYSETSTKRTPN